MAGRRNCATFGQAEMTCIEALSCGVTTIALRSWKTALCVVGGFGLSGLCVQRCLNMQFWLKGSLSRLPTIRDGTLGCVIFDPAVKKFVQVILDRPSAESFRRAAAWLEQDQGAQGQDTFSRIRLVLFSSLGRSNRIVCWNGRDFKHGAIACSEKLVLRPARNPASNYRAGTTCVQE